MPLDATRAHLAALYAGNPDPWGHLTRTYEREKYAATLDVIGAGPFGAALEIGCGNGALTERLAPRCRDLTAIELIPAALALARQGLAAHPHVRLVGGSAPDDLPPMAPDLIVLSEVLYFLTPLEIDALAWWIDGHARPRCRVVAVNWAGPTGEALSGPAALAQLRRALPTWQGRCVRHERYQIDVLERCRSLVTGNKSRTPTARRSRRKTLST